MRTIAKVRLAAVQQTIELLTNSPLTYKEIAEAVGVSLSFVFEVRRSHGIPNRVRGRRLMHVTPVTDERQEG